MAEKAGWWTGLSLALLSGLTVASTADAQVMQLSDGDRATIAALLSKDDGFGQMCDGVILPGSPRTALVSVDYSGRHFCNQVMRIRLARRPSILDTFDAYAVGKVSAIVRSASPDGRMEIALPREFSDAGDRSQCRAVVSSLLRCDRSRCVETRPRRFLTEQLAQREQALATPVDAGDEQLTRRRVCLTAERDKLRRMIGQDRTAGVSQADMWSASDDLFLRRMAIFVYMDVGDAQSRRKLRQLAADPDASVSGLARTWLEARPQR
jgi:hypothetical protein